MNITLYLFILIFKIVENALATLRVIVIANGRKLIGAILNLIMSIIWVITTGIVIVDINKDPIKIVMFALGTFIGSYMGSIIEEKLAMGNNMLLCVIDSHDLTIINKIKELGLNVIKTKGTEENQEKYILFIMVKRKQIKKITNIIKRINKGAIVIEESANDIYMKKAK